MPERGAGPAAEALRAARHAARAMQPVGCSAASASLWYCDCERYVTAQGLIARRWQEMERLIAELRRADDASGAGGAGADRLPCSSRLWLLLEGDGGGGAVTGSRDEVPRTGPERRGGSGKQGPILDGMQQAALCSRTRKNAARNWNV